jgi:hypothetical protein
MNISGTMMQADFDFDLHTNEKHVASPHDLFVCGSGPRRGEVGYTLAAEGERS